ncbi:MAG: HAD family hydrolase [Nitriliruptoraceae bacterium]
MLRELPDGVSPGGRFATWSAPAPRYVVCDVDGTLVGSSAGASEAVVRAVRAAQARGIAVGVATGRMRAATRALRAQLNIDGPHIHFDGAAVHHEHGVLDSRPLQLDDAAALLDLVRGVADAYVEFYTADTYVVSAHDERAAAHWQMLGQQPAAVAHDAGDLAGHVWLKATIVTFDQGRRRRERLAKAVAALGLRAGASTSPRTPDLAYLNVTDPGVDKGWGVVRAASYLGVELTRVMAVGDAPNDLPMLTRAGTAVAMGQAARDVRDTAHLVVEDIDHDGAATALRAAATWNDQDVPGTL